MFDMIAEVVIGLLKSIYGITTSVVSSVINTVVTGKLIVRQTGGTAGSNEIQYYFDQAQSSTNTAHFNIAQNATCFWVFDVAGTAQFIFTTDTVSPSLRVNSNTGGLDLGSVNSTGAGICRIAQGVVGPRNGGSAGGWFQSTDGEKYRTATQTVTDSTTFAADNTLSVTLIAGRKYRFYLFYYFTTVNSSGVKIDLNGGTASMTAINGVIQLITPATYVTSNVSQITALTSSAALTASGTLHYGCAEGTLQCNLVGTFAPRFAQNTETGAAESVIAQIGSFLTLADMP